MRKNTTRSNCEQRGEITAIRDCGTIIIVLLRTDQWTTPVFFDHRSFGSLLAGEECGAEQLIGRRASFDGRTLHFLD